MSKEFKAHYMKVSGLQHGKTVESIRQIIQAALLEEASKLTITVTSPDVTDVINALKALVFEIKSDPTALRFFDERLIERAEAALRTAEDTE